MGLPGSGKTTLSKLPNQIDNLMNYIKNEKKIDGQFKKIFSKDEKLERRLRADPIDGLRPMKNFRKKL